MTRPTTDPNACSRGNWLWRLGVPRRMIAMAAVVISTTGCQLWPDMSHPGTAPSQQRRAALHDPYPDPDLAPAVVGGRPREFQVPYHEPVKSRAFTDIYNPPR